MSTIITRWLSCMRRIEELFKPDVHLARVLLLFGGFGLISMASHNFVGLSYVIAKLSSICFISSSKCLSFFCLDNLINSSSQIFEFSPFRPGILLYKLSVCLIFFVKGSLAFIFKWTPESRDSSSTNSFTGVFDTAF